MILKLFKYDFMNIGKKLIPFYIAALVIGVINRFLLLTSNISRMEREGNFLAMFGSPFLYAAYFLVIMGIFFMTVFIIISRYSSSIYGNEGYLTNTLPLNPSQIILAKLINFLIWILISYFIIFVSLFILFPFDFFLRNVIYEPEFYEGLKKLTKLIFSSKYGFLFALQFIYNFFSHIQNILMLFLSVAIANLFKSYKVVAGVIAFFLISTVFSFIASIISFSVMENVNLFEMYGEFNPIVYNSLKNANIMSIIYSIVSSIVLFFIIHYLHTHNLNLE
ncbi:hypothetical protein [Leptotrichia sp. oral taxon 212]|jgi:hypothetical protein|uniref:hypothetical protein n=1 Tax=Leptotrichia sp. oral taxon 212 TaxID=712357 RepID=UPI0006A9F561|nr:hypothetical protein [Leptotrichia sp. oral taxon 212]ALA96522.1 hypothetical protein AMK43_11390 [Leptotrichia sp. oral taxon 212]